MAIETTLGPFPFGADIVIPVEHPDRLNWSGWTATFDILDAYDGTALLSKTTSSGITLTTGTGTVSLASAETTRTLLSTAKVWTFSRVDSGARDVLGNGVILFGPASVHGT